MRAEEPLELFRYRYLDSASHIWYSFTLGMPQQILQKIQKTQRERMEVDLGHLGGLILEKLSDTESKQLKEMLGVDVFSDTFSVDRVAPHPSLLSDLKSLDGEQGRKFWIYPRQSAIEMPSAHKIELRVESPSGKKVFGFVIIGIPENQFLELKAKFPDEGFKGINPRLNEAIKQDITKEENERIAEHLSLRPNTESKFECERILRYLDETKEKPRFESNGKKFWIFPRES